MDAREASMAAGQAYVSLDTLIRHHVSSGRPLSMVLATCTTLILSVAIVARKGWPTCSVLRISAIGNWGVKQIYESLKRGVFRQRKFKIVQKGREFIDHFARCVQVYCITT
jgi:hypothetical protein